jgi:hypothetical protein
MIETKAQIEDTAAGQMTPGKIIFWELPAPKPKVGGEV